MKSSRRRGREAVWKVSVRTTAEAEEAVTELLRQTFQEPVTSYTDVETRQTTVSVYLNHKPAWASRDRERLAAGLRRIRNCGLSVGPAKIRLDRVRQQDWAESWKRHFKPFAIGSALLVRPEWSRRRPRTRQQVVQINPGLSFGTGQHPTTLFCLKELVARRVASAEQSFLDLGTGSGILGIAAAKLGYRPVEAMDIDATALRTARENARRNRVRGIRFKRQDVGRLPLVGGKKYSVVCANLVGNLLLEHRKRIVATVSPGGILVLAGILASEFSQVQSAYEEIGLCLLRSRLEKEWRSGSFAK